jgi:hypothetical protein
MRATLLFVLCLPAMAATRTVCVGGSCNHTTINAAIAASSCGDTIQVKVGGGGGANGEHLAGDGVSAPISLSKVCPAGNEVTITTDQASRLPAAETLITPAYADGASRIVPRVTSVGNGRLLEAVNGASHASGFKLIGLELFCGGTAVNAAPAQSPCIGVGYGPLGTLEPSINAVSDLPTNITFDRIIVRNDPTLNSSPQPVVFDPNGGFISNSWISAGTNHASDSQGIWMSSAQNVTIRNSYISGQTESFALQGACSPIHDYKSLGPGSGECVSSTITMVPTNITVEHNEITHEPWQYTRPWTASARVPKGQWTQISTGATTSMQCRFQALNAGVTGTTEPVWANMPNLLDTAVDGSVTWQNMGVCGGTKNLFESKGSSNLVLRNNSLHDVYYSPFVPYGGQGYALTLTSRTTAGAGAGSASQLAQTTLENNVIRDAGLALNISGFDGFDQNVYPTLWPASAGPYVINSGGNDKLSVTTNTGSCTITLTAGSRTPAQIQADVNGSSCNTKVWSCLVADRFVIRASTDGPNTCATAASSSNAYWAHIVASPTANDAAATLGITESATHYSCENPRTGVWYGCGLVDGLSITNNLFAGLNKDAAHGMDRLYNVSLFGRVHHVRFQHNTLEVDPTNHGPGYPLYFFLTDPGGSHSPFDVHIVDNILGYTKDRDHYVATNTESLNAALPNGGAVHDFSAVNYSFCQTAGSTRSTPPSDVLCADTTGVFSHNLIPGARLHTGTTMDTRPVQSNLGFLKYPKSNWNTTWESIPFQNRVNFGMLTYTAYPTINELTRGASDSGQVGADPADLPLIRNLVITPSDRAAVASFTITAPVSSFACVARVSADPTMLSTAVPVPILADLDPSLYVRPDSSDADWLPTSGQQRWFVFGHNSALSAGTTYYYHLNCGGAYANGSFKTLAARAGTGSVTIGRTPVAPAGGVATCLVEYGTAYSRSEDKITGASTTTACSAGSPYSVSISSTETGVPLYVRVKYLDTLNNLLSEEPVTIVVPL